ncbi:MAG: hypothetical protein ACPL1A_10070 [Candidatus Kapaibacteriota bacterium]
MKTIYICIFFLLALFLGNFNNSYADPYNCFENCKPYLSKVLYYSFPLPGCQDCTITVEYQSGDCQQIPPPPDSGGCILKINSINLSGNCSNCPYTVNELINLSAVELLKNIQSLLSCSVAGDTIKSVDLYNAPCMKWVGELGTHEPTNATLVPCLSDGCCVAHYLLVKQPGDIWTVTRLFQQVNGICTDPSTDCFTTCE